MQSHRRLLGPMDSHPPGGRPPVPPDTGDDAARDPQDPPDPPETYNPWSIVNLVFRHLAAEGLHPVLGEAGDPGAPAAALLRALGITPVFEGSRHAVARVEDDLAKLRAAYEADQSR
jgi:hypothetical protein